jgi:hypothetical protein
MSSKDMNGKQTSSGPTANSADKINQTDDSLKQIAQGVLSNYADIPNYRTTYGRSNRNEGTISWRLPNGSAVQMYINPENLQIQDSKQITEVRTKGGFVIQYWGENLTNITLSGTTGSSGVEGVNVLRDIYRSENRGFDVIAAQLQNEIEDRTETDLTSDNMSTQLQSLATERYNRQFLLRPSLAALATSVIMYYQGVQYKGFFKSMNVTEDVSKLGMFTYQLTFMATETRGQRKNFMAWHKKPLANDIAGQLINGVGNALRGVFWPGQSTTGIPSSRKCTI